VAVVYAAKSTEDTHGSIPDQIERCREYATANGWEVAEPPESDEAASAYTGSRGPGLTRAKEHAAALASEGRETVLLVFATDRLARGDGRTAAHLVEHVLDGIKAGYRIESVTENLGGEMALVLASLYGERAHADSKAKGEHTRRGIERMVRSGRWHGPAPFGYRAAGQREERHLVVDDVAAAVVKRIFDEYVTAGSGTALIAHHLNEDGIQPPRAKRWDGSTVANILKQVAYIGQVKVNGETFPGNHEPIIEEAVWLRAQAQREARKPGTSHIGRPPNGTHLLTGGLLRCGICGGAMAPRSPRGRQDRYDCATRNRSGGHTRCTMKGVLRTAVDEPLLTYLEAVVFDLDATRQVIAEEHDRRSTDYAALIAQAEREATQAEEALVRIRGDYMRGALTVEQWQGFEAELTETREAAAREVDQLTARAEQLTAEVEAFNADEEVASRLAMLREVVAGEIRSAEGLAAVRTTLRRCFESVTLVHADEQGAMLVPAVRAVRIPVPGKHQDTAPCSSHPFSVDDEQGERAPT
jgi:DNA invertase Pin-like site-specific DNA recombinase